MLSSAVMGAACVPLRHRWRGLVVFTVLIAVGWGLLVGEVVGGTAVALANVAVGALFGQGLGCAGRALAAGRPHPSVRGSRPVRR
jgi:energy-converting hydrogenase Eha subunit A